MYLRLRLTLAYMALLLPALVAFSVVTYLIASQRIYSALDDTLLERIDGVAAVLPKSGELNTNDARISLSTIDTASLSDFAFKLVGADGQLLYGSSRGAVANLPDPRAFAKGPATSITRGSGGSQRRLAYEEVNDADGNTVGYIVGGVSFRQTDAALDVLRGVFVIGGVLVLILTGAPAYLLAGRALRPVREVSAAAAQIERTGDFETRLQPPRFRGETTELVDTFNSMIDRVRRMLLAQKQFLADSSHELRRPLTVMRTYIDVLEDPTISPDERAASLREMRHEAEAMSGLITDLLLLSREGESTGQRQAVDIAAICAKLYERVRGQDTAHAYSLKEPAQAKVIGQSEWLERMVSNLIENAAQYTPARGAIDIGVERTNGVVRIRVSDTGSGIPADERAHIFERFFRGRKAQESRAEGIGLGLVIVKHVAEDHGGSVRFESEEGAGSVFTVELPAVD